MRTSVTILQYEHGVIGQMLDVLSEVIRTHKVEENSEDVGELMAFLYEYADHFHHDKEERLFLPVVRQQFPELNEGIERILDEHLHIQKLFEEVFESLDKKDWGNFNRSGMELVRHKIAHYENEEHHVFTSVDENLPLDIDESLNQSYARHLSVFGEDYNQRADLFANEIQDRLLGPRFFNQGIY